jgi:small subunit ribosomal protein S18
MPPRRRKRVNDRRNGKKGLRKFRRKVCKFCVEKLASLDYKDTSKLQRCLTEKGKIISRRISGNCARHQRQVGLAVKRARQIALLPYTVR